MHVRRNIAALVALMAIAPLSARAQRAGTIEVGAFGHYSKLDNDVRLGSSSVGAGARVGFFAMRYLSLEAEYSFGTISDNVRGVSSWTPFRGIVVANATLAPRVKLLLGAGYKYDTWRGDTTKNQYEDAFTALVGLRFCLNNAWSIRPEMVYDKNPSPNFQRPVTETSRYFGFRVGVSKFFGRGAGTCADKAAAAAPPPVVAPPVVAAPPVTPPPPQRPTASLSVAPSSISAGQRATLAWGSTNATSCAAPWMTGSAASGTQSVNPTSTTNYNVTCTGPGGSASASASLNVTPAAPPPPPPTPPAPPRQLYQLLGVNFDFDKSTIKPEGKIKLDSAITVLNQFPDMRVEIQGHTDSVGTTEYNQGLSERRAKAVLDYLVSKGISASRLVPKGYSENNPIATNDTREGRALNRRVMLIELR